MERTRKAQSIRRRVAAATVAALVLSVGAGATPASAAEGGWYVGGAWGESVFEHRVADFDDGSLTSGAVDGSDVGWKLFGGYRFAKHLSLEAGYTVLDNLYDGRTSFGGVSDGTGTRFGAGLVGVDIHRPEATFVAVVGILPVAKGVALHGKLGFQAWDAQVTVFDSSRIVQRDESGTDLLVGFGIEYQVWRRMSMRAEWERFMDIVEDDIDLVSVGISVGIGPR